MDSRLRFDPRDFDRFFKIVQLRSLPVRRIVRNDFGYCLRIDHDDHLQKDKARQKTVGRVKAQKELITQKTIDLFFSI